MVALLYLYVILSIVKSCISSEFWPGPQVTSMKNGKEIWTATIKGEKSTVTKDYRVNDLDPRPMLVYNCHNVPALCQTVKSYLGSRTSGTFHYDRWSLPKERKSKTRTAARRKSSCGGDDGVQWIDSKRADGSNRCPEPDKPGTWKYETDQSEHTVMWRKSDGTNISKNRLAKKVITPKEDGTGYDTTYVTMGAKLTCDEWPAASWIEGGAGSSIYCAPVAASCKIDKDNDKHVDSLQTEQDWQANGHSAIYTYIKPRFVATKIVKSQQTNSDQWTIWKFDFKYVNEVNGDAVWLEAGGKKRYCYGPNASNANSSPACKPIWNEDSDSDSSDDGSENLIELRGETGNVTALDRVIRIFSSKDLNLLSQLSSHGSYRHPQNLRNLSVQGRRVRKLFFIAWKVSPVRIQQVLAKFYVFFDRAKDYRKLRLQWQHAADFNIVTKFTRINGFLLRMVLWQYQFYIMIPEISFFMQVQDQGMQGTALQACQEQQGGLCVTMRAMHSSFLCSYALTIYGILLLFASGVSASEMQIENPHWRDLHIRRSLGSRSNGTLNSTLFEAERLVELAQEEARIRNEYLVQHVRKNKYEIKDFTASPMVSADLITGTGVNDTVARADALVTEYLAKNESRGGTLLERQATSYWMENMVQNGKSPYVTDSTYKAVVYFPTGTYLVSGTLIQYYFTQFIGNPLARPVIKAKSTFVGLGVISSDEYIVGGDGGEWYINQSNFYRQIRNIVIDITDAPQQAYVAAIYWQVAQATSLQNVKFIMSVVPGNNQQGIFMENGSGGFLSDLEFSGGSIGAYVGNQQFSVRNLKFSNHQTAAIHIHWDWGWTWKGVDISNCPIAILMSTPGASTEVGSAIFIDSKITNCPVGISVQLENETNKATLSIFSLSTSNVPAVVQNDKKEVLLSGSSGATVVKAWGIGRRYDTDSQDSKLGGTWQAGASYPRAPIISSMLLKDSANQQSGLFERSKPQYELIPASDFVNIKLSPYSAIGDGVHDDTAALNAALLAVSASNKILWIPAGVYLVSDTVFIPRGAKIVGQSWAQIIGAGVKFEDIKKPYPVVQVGRVGDTGSVEIQDLLFTVRGKTAGAVILQWNIHESTQGSAAMWDTHIRVGGAKGSDLQATNCPKKTGSISTNCISAAVLVHITSKASAYFENTWFWVADHDLDIPAQTQIDVYVGRGVLIESTGPVWLYGTASEHCVLYQYQTVDASNIFMGMIQTESPYYQTAPNAPAPFSISSGFNSDPTFDDCKAGSKTCAVSWAKIVKTACSKSTQAAVPVGGTAVLGADNHINYCSVVMAWLGSSLGGSNNLNGVKHISPISATVIPFTATTVASTATFTIGPAGQPIVANVYMQPNDGNQNQPKGPGDDQCVCDLARLITSTCCGIGGGVSSPIEISPGVPIPKELILPVGFTPNQEVIGTDGQKHAPSQPFTEQVVVSAGTIFLFPFVIPPGLSLSNLYTPGADDSGDDYTMYIITTFWEGPHTVSCSYPCTVLFPPLVVTSTWTPRPFVTSKDGQTETVTIPVQTTQRIRISKTTIKSSDGSSPTKVIFPIPAPKPLCIKITLPILGTITFGLCPPKLDPFPPKIPDVTIIPVPPGKKPGPTMYKNVPSQDHKDEEKEEEDEDEGPEESTCSDSDPDSPFVDIPGDDSNGGSGSPVGAGTGSPTTATVVVTETAVETVHVPATSTILVPAPAPPVPIPSPAPAPAPDRPVPNPDTEEKHCFGSSSRQVDGNKLDNAYKDFCDYVDGTYLDATMMKSNHVSVKRSEFTYYILVPIQSKNNCAWIITKDNCKRIFKKVVGCKPYSASLLRVGGTVTDNCATYTLDPVQDIAGICIPIPIFIFMCLLDEIFG
ncbi:hypothetical protein VTL71DRAFT_9502 [Oculimacula yallundae]|uniref:Rhamnogalacturonase A/B/Epimerase-like pectate lyase domain-containing protein n=1 Tax=Oculimacula yallundae TaxID=86028 RepID=A0ABR4BTE2_9HELO